MKCDWSRASEMRLRWWIFVQRWWILVLMVDFRSDLIWGETGENGEREKLEKTLTCLPKAAAGFRSIELGVSGGTDSFELIWEREMKAKSESQEFVFIVDPSGLKWEVDRGPPRVFSYSYYKSETPIEMERLGVGRLTIPEMESHQVVTEEVPSTPAFWDLSDLLDFTTDDHFNLPLESDQIDLNPQPEPQQEPPAFNNSERVRKRDPRLTCPNFLAQIPCACPELDEKLEEEATGLPGKKRARMVRARRGQGLDRCRVPACQADISELKGYHKRHKVCLRCANASAVFVDGDSKRYCQQCGKFHALSYFDEGKKSCRRKLEHHNIIRRRKSVDSKGAVDSEPSGAPQSEDIICNDELAKDSFCLSSQITDKEDFLESEDGLVSALNSAPNTQNVHNDSGISVIASGEIRTDGGKADPRASLSPSYCDNKSSYSSLCPTGRISFKLYDWNPAEFPRRLRHQIFQWLASMPVELEGYIRPGCTILTVFIAMPKIMWVKLYEDPVRYVHDFVVAPGRMLSGRGSMFVHLNNLIFHVKDGTSVMKVDVKVQAPRLHYVHPMCFEAGKPMELVACGSNLLHSKFRFLISFAGKYLPYDYCIAPPHGANEGEPLVHEHQFYKINVSHTEVNLFGPAFIEVENEYGLSNFIPVVIGDGETCSEMKTIQERFEASFFPKRSQFMASGSMSNLREVSVLRQKALSDLFVDIAWLLKVPASESFRQIMSTSQVRRFNRILSFLIYNESITVLEKILENLKILMDNIELNSAVNNISDIDMRLLLKYMDYAREILGKKLKKNQGSIQHSENIVPERIWGSQNCFKGNLFDPSSNEDLVTGSNDKLGVLVDSATDDRCEIVPLVNKEAITNSNLIKEWPRKSCSHILSGRVLSSHPTLFVIAMAAVCFGACLMVLHPQKVGHFATSIRRVLFGNL